MPEIKQSDINPKKLVSALAYCDLCKIPVGFGAFNRMPSHFDDKSKTVHEAKLVQMDTVERIGIKETPGDFLKRMMKKYVG